LGKTHQNCSVNSAQPIQVFSQFQLGNSQTCLDILWVVGTAAIQ
jgi:hypothetical protein